MSLNFGEVEQRLKAVEDHEHRLKALEDIIFERGMTARGYDTVAFCFFARYGLSRLRALLLRHLLQNKVGFYGVLAEIVETEGSGQCADPDAVMKVQISQIRAALKADGIEIRNASKVGFYLTDEHKALLKEKCGITAE